MPRPLAGVTVVLTRAAEEAEHSSRVFTRLGAEVINLPCISIVPAADYTETDACVGQLGDFDFLIFQSVNAVRYFFKRVLKLGAAVFSGKPRVIAVGKKTEAACEELGIPVSIVPVQYSAAGVAGSLGNENLFGKRVLIPRSRIGRDELPEYLAGAGADVYTPVVYDTVLPQRETLQPVLAEIERRKPEWFVFTSPSTVTNFLQLCPISPGANAAAIGETTAAALRAAGITPGVVAGIHTLEGVCDGIVAALAARGTATV